MSSIELGAPLPPATPSGDTLTLLSQRRSTPALLLEAPGPEGEALDALIALAARVPDHRMIVPFRFVVIGTALRGAFADKVREAAGSRDDGTDPEKVLRLIAHAPAMLALISSPDPDHKTPVWEQELTVGSVGQNLLIAAAAAGWGAQWLTGWMAYDGVIATALGLTRNERVAGFFYLGTQKEAPTERRRPTVEEVRRHWAG